MTVLLRLILARFCVLGKGRPLRNSGGNLHEILDGADINFDSLVIGGMSTVFGRAPLEA
jgi:hypothetical protein